MKIGDLAIKTIEFDLRSRDEIPELLMGLQSIYCNREVRIKIQNETRLPNIYPSEMYQYLTGNY